MSWLIDPQRPKHLTGQQKEEVKRDSNIRELYQIQDQLWQKICTDGFTKGPNVREKSALEDYNQLKCYLKSSI